MILCLPQESRKKEPRPCKSADIDILSDSGNTGILLEGKSDSFERDSEKVINGFLGRVDSGSLPNRENLSPENEF